MEDTPQYAQPAPLADAALAELERLIANEEAAYNSGSIAWKEMYSEAQATAYRELPALLARLRVAEARTVLPTVPAAAPVAQSGWVSCADRLPERIGHYLCLCNDGQHMVCSVTVLGDWTALPGGQYYGDLWADGTSDDESSREVTHWQPLPTPPTSC